jgi:hypothetical protein
LWRVKIYRIGCLTLLPRGHHPLPSRIFPEDSSCRRTRSANQSSVKLCEPGEDSCTSNIVAGISPSSPHWHVFGRLLVELPIMLPRSQKDSTLPGLYQLSDQKIYTIIPMERKKIDEANHHNRHRYFFQRAHHKRVTKNPNELRFQQVETVRTGFRDRPELFSIFCLQTFLARFEPAPFRPKTCCYLPRKGTHANSSTDKANTHYIRSLLL